MTERMEDRIMRTIRIGSRESRLAVVQSELVQRYLQEQGIDAPIITMKTTGDKILDRTLDQVGGKGLFVKELDAALLDGRSDISVHSLKDVPADAQVKVTFAADAAVYQRDYAEEVYEILEKAQITYAQKTEVYKVVKELGTEAVPVLVSMNLNPSLLGVLMEILTMGI